MQVFCAPHTRGRFISCHLPPAVTKRCIPYDTIIHRGVRFYHHLFSQSQASNPGTKGTIAPSKKTAAREYLFALSTKKRCQKARICTDLHVKFQKFPRATIPHRGGRNLPKPLPWAPHRFAPSSGLRPHQRGSFPPEKNKLRDCKQST